MVLTRICIVYTAIYIVYNSCRWSIFVIILWWPLSLCFFFTHCFFLYVSVASVAPRMYYMCVFWIRIQISGSLLCVFLLLLWLSRISYTWTFKFYRLATVTVEFVTAKPTTLPIYRFKSITDYLFLKLYALACIYGLISIWLDKCLLFCSGYHRCNSRRINI